MNENDRILGVNDYYSEKIEGKTPYLYRYMNFSSFMGILETGSLIFHSIDLFNDPYEGFMFETLLKRVIGSGKRQRSISLESD